MVKCRSLLPDRTLVISTIIQPHSHDLFIYTHTHTHTHTPTHPHTPNPPQPRIKLATLEKLVERLTFEEYPDMEFVEAFMLTYRSFTSPLELMELIVARYCITPPAGLSKDELLEYKTKRQTPIRLRAFNVLMTWITDHFYDFEDDPELIAMMREFVETTMPATGMPRPAQRLQRMLDRVTEEKRDEDMMLQASALALGEGD